MSYNRDAGGAAPFAGAITPEHRTLSNHIINMLETFLEDDQVRSTHINTTTRLLELVSADELMQWYNINLAIGTRATHLLISDPGLSASTIIEADSLHHRVTQPQVPHTTVALHALTAPIGHLSAAPIQSSSSVGHSGTADETTLANVQCPYPNCTKSYKSTTMRRFLSDHIIRRHGLPEQQAMVQVSAMYAVSRTGHQQATTPRISMSEIQDNTGNNQLPDQSHSIAMFGFGGQFGAERLTVPNSRTTNGRRPRYPMNRSASVNAASIARLSAQPSVEPREIFGLSDTTDPTVMGSSSVWPDSTYPTQSSWGGEFTPDSWE